MSQFAFDNNASQTPATAQRTFHPPLITTQPIIFIPYIGVTSLAMTVGVVGNVALIATLLVNRGLQKVGREFMVNMCVADLCVTGLADPLCILAAVNGEEYFAERPALCTIIASLCLTACFCAFLSLSCITMSRMIFICHNDWYDALFAGGKAWCLCVLCWLVGMGMEIGNFFGWGGHYYDTKSESCIWDRTASLSYTYFVGLGLITGPLVMMLVSNFKIFKSIVDTKSDLVKAQKGDSAHPSSVWKETLRSCKTLLCMFFTFCVCWIPYTVVILLDVNDNVVSEDVHLYTTMLAHLHSALIVCVYMTNCQIREAVLRTVCRMRTRDSSHAAGGNSSAVAIAATAGTRT